MENIKKELRAAIYTRVSSDEQTKGYGLEYQLDESKKLIERDGRLFMGEYSDPGISGTIEERPGLNRLREDVRLGKFEFIYAYKSDRLARDDLLQLRLYREFKEHDVEFVSATEPHMNDLMRGIYAVFGAEELRTIKRRMYEGRLRAMRDGKWIGPIPYGYIQDKKTLKLDINEKEAEWIRKLFRWFVDERMTTNALAKKACAVKVPTSFDIRGKEKPKYGKYFWSKGMMARLLTRDYYATGEAWFCKYKNPDLRRFGKAELRPEGDWIAVKVPPIISQALFDQAQEQLVKNRVFARRRAFRTYLFSKKIRCGSCGSKLAASCKPGTEKKFYRGDLWSEERCGECRYYTEKDLETAIWGGIKNFFQEPDRFLAELDAYGHKDNKMDELKAEELGLLELEKETAQQEKQVLDFHLNKTYSDEAIAGKQRELKKRREDIAARRMEIAKRRLMEERRHENAVSARQLYINLKSIFENPTYEDKGRVFNWLIEKVVMHGRRAEIWLNLPGTEAAGILLQAAPPSVGMLNGNENSEGKTGLGGKMSFEEFMRRDLETVGDVKELSAGERVAMRNESYP